MWFCLRNIQWLGNMSNLLPAVGEKKPGAARCADRHRWARGQGSSSPSFGTSRSTTVPGSETWLPDLSAGAHKNRGNGNGSRAWNLWDVIYEWHVFCVGSVPRKGLVAGDHSLCSFLSAKLMRQLGAEVMPCLVDECLAVWPGGLLWLGASEWLWFKLNLPEKNMMSLDTIVIFPGILRTHSDSFEPYQHILYASQGRTPFKTAWKVFTKHIQKPCATSSRREQVVACFSLILTR